MEAQVKNHEFNAASLWVLHAVLWESKFNEKLAQGRADATARLRAGILQGTRGKPDGPAAGPAGEDAVADVAVRKFEAVMDLVVQDLGVLEWAGSRRD